MAAPVELPPPPPEAAAACDGGVEFALGSAFSSRSLCSAAAADDEDEEAEELEALPAVVVVWGTYQRFEGNFDCIDRFLDA